MIPRYPEIQVRLHSQNPFAWVSAIRQALRLSHVADEEIERFTEQALEAGGPGRMRATCTAWARVEHSP